MPTDSIFDDEDELIIDDSRIFQQMLKPPATNDFIIFVNELYRVIAIDENAAQLQNYTRKERGGNVFGPLDQPCPVPVEFLIHDFHYLQVQVTLDGDCVKLEPQQARKVA